MHITNSFPVYFKVNQNGSTLIEILVALLIVTVSLIGHAGMQSMAIDSTHTANIHGISAYQAGSLASRMRANSNYWRTIEEDKAFNINISNNNGTSKLSNDGDSFYDSLLTYATDCATTSCSPEQLAAFDIKAWGQTQIDKFPNGQARITRLAGPRAVFHITLMWREKQMSSLGKTQSAATNLDKTYQIRVEP
ncbi:MAG: type IV pilus modification protein PilV [Gammaproteobacteria bacterium]|nr:type IV pilus modification protein PilV [Gammaproteobacteria bacterium]